MRINEKENKMDILKELMGTEDEKPLDRLVTDGGFCGIFRRICCIGDSLSSGEFESSDEKNENKGYHDMFDYSWGQYLGRLCGSTVLNYSRGGMTAKEFCDSYACDHGYWNVENACQAYIIALGVNDMYHLEIYNGEIGTTDDICKDDYKQNKPTFVGYYAQIIQRMKKIQPRAKFFLMTMPSESYGNEMEEKIRLHAEKLHELADYFSNTYVLDFCKYAPKYNSEFKKNFYLGGHMNPCGYLFTAKMTASYIDYIIRHNMQDFDQVGFIGTNLGNHGIVK